MSGRFHQAEALLALASLGAGSFRTDGGRLDLALQDMGDDLPDVLKGRLSFGCGSVGLRCYELPEILDAAFYMLLADYGPRGDHNVVHSKLSTDEAREIAIQYHSTIAEFTRIAAKLSDLNHRGTSAA
ncbi:hypothetical protein OIU34_21000 [Pararhizobium sp. BT-229]|uniref:hypothetical protein n=1 Tax=Pararhizobium sp. BT-229 TaxID=2986923 RepID=UPI0021F6E821|nr:hypothetical protein [Pararhizobium sp. BT-229]MCV9964369.1 hypothetical protein [Pararhizobium sp. BT-229]